MFVIILGLAMLGAILVLPKSPLRGWAEIIGFGTVGLVYLFGGMAGPRRKHWAFGIYMFVAGVDFGLSQVWPAEPWWLQNAMQVVFILAVILFVIESARSTKQAASTA
jgi:hypothetical protein